jgi:gamma-glutamyltranspeptidase/glutathione hydrolase
MRRHPLALALVFAALVALLAGAQGAGAQDPPKTPTARGTGGAAASVDVLATNAAVDSLSHGGNAVDAAVAAAGVLGVVEPFSCGIGGGGFMVIRTPHGKVTTIDGRETAPASMQPDVFIDPATGTPLAFNDARFSGLSAGVPGTPATWSRALRKYGTTTLKQALAPGIRVATDGYTVDQTFFNQVNDVKDYFDDVPSTAALYLDADGSPKDVGTTIRNADMAKTYRILAAEGTKKGFYRGPVAAATAQAAAHPPISPSANHTWRQGLMTTDDLKRYTAPERKPVVSDYRGYTVYGMGPPSSGGSTVAEVLNILDGYQPTTDPITTYHRLLEASRYAFADRNAYVGDPAFFDVPLEGLTSLSFAAERRALIGPTAATSPVEPGNPYDDQGHGRHHGRGHASATISHPRQSTTHLTVVDKRGMMVSYTFTIESIGGNAVTVPGYGFLLNNELTDFNFTPSSPNRPDPNLPDGGKRPRSSMSPTIIEQDGEPFLAVGSPGGSTIIGTVLEILVNRFDLGQSLPQAIATPRAVERNTATHTAELKFIQMFGPGLEALGHKFPTPPPAPNFEIGAATGIEVHGSQLTAAAEPQRRGVGSAGVVTPSP